MVTIEDMKLAALLGALVVIGCVGDVDGQSTARVRPVDVGVDHRFEDDAQPLDCDCHDASCRRAIAREFVHPGECISVVCAATPAHQQEHYWICSPGFSDRI